MDYVSIIGQLGFPIVVAAYLLFKVEAKVEAAEKAAIIAAEKLEKHMTCCHKCQENNSTTAATSKSSSNNNSNNSSNNNNRITAREEVRE